MSQGNADPPLEPPPRVHYADADGVSVAYQAFGNGPRTVISVPSFAQNIEMIWEQPEAVRYFERLGSMAQVIQFDKRGTGKSDRRLPPASLEDRVQDLVAVMDANEIERAIIMGTSEGGTLATFFAATYPERTEALILKGGHAAFVRTDDHPWMPSGKQRLRKLRTLGPLWGKGYFTTKRMAPSMAQVPGFRRWAAAYEQRSLERSNLLRWCRLNMALDTRHVLPSIQVPVLVAHTAEDRQIPIECSHYLAERIPIAQFVELEGADHVPWFSAQDGFLDAVEDFVANPAPTRRRGRALATVLFTDIVGSTDLASKLGDDRWMELLGRHDELTRAEVAASGGSWIKSTGDGALATFESPSRAIHSACRIRNRVAADCGFEIRAGLHTAEIEIRGNDVGGIAVHEAARVQATAGPGEVVTSAATRGLVSGPRIDFTDHGIKRLKGLPEPAHLFLATTAPSDR